MPHNSDTRNVEHLKREAERSREELAQTVHRIRDAVSDATADLGESIAPETIKANIGDYVRTRGENLMEAARQNPMQAAAIGALAAYPVMALARRIPAPLMMIGAGLFLMNSETGRNLSQKATERAEDLAEQGQRMAHDWRDKSADTLSSVVEQASSVGASIRGSVSETADDARRYAAHLGSTVGESVSDARRSVSETAEDARRYAAHLGSTVDDNISDARRSMRDADYGQSMRDLRGNAMNSVQATVGATTDALTSWARENPVLTAVIGMAVGGLVASAIPVTRAEVRLAETATGDLRRRFGDVVTTAQGAVDQAAERTAQQGLTPESIADASRDFGERALKVAEAAAGAALSRTDQQDNTHTPAGA